jgi:hypothetical protein
MCRLREEEKQSLARIRVDRERLVVKRDRADGNPLAVQRERTDEIRQPWIVDGPARVLMR